MLYGTVVPKQHMNDLEKIQIEARRIVSSATKLVALERLQYIES